MPRADFSVDLFGTISHTTFGETTGPDIATAKRSSETVLGVTRRKPTGFIPPQPYRFEKIKHVFQHGSCAYNPNVLWGVVYQGIVGNPQGTGRFTGDQHFMQALSEEDVRSDNGLRNTCLIAVRNKLKRTDINLGVAFGERKQTARLVGDTAKRIARSYRALRRGQVRNAMRELGVSSKKREPSGANVPRQWLEMQYGWKPLLSDVYGATSALEKRPKGDWRVTATATRSEIEDRVFDFIGQDLGTCRARLKRSVFTRIDALPQNEAIISLASLGVTNPLSVAWELVPFSFVVDWFLPVGGFLESLDATLGYTDFAYSSSLFCKATWSDEGRSGIEDGVEVINSYSGTKMMVYLDREVGTSVPLPSMPRIKDPRSLGHMANGLALLAQAFGR